MSTSGMNVNTQQLIASHRAAVVRPVAAPSVAAGTAVPQSEAKNGAEFSQLLQSRIGEVRFSAHAATRMRSRSIEMTPEMMGKLQKAVDGAAGKGSRDSLVLLKNYAFIVNIPNRTVVTAMDGQGMKENIFTNIDSAVVAD
jgi:flagellar operon protein